MPDAITINAFVPVAAAEAWEAFTSAAAIMQWNQASPDWHCPSASVDLRVGGRHVARMEARDAVRLITEQGYSVKEVSH